MKAELTESGFIDMTNASEVSAALQQTGTTLVVVNSVCGCAAGTARPGIMKAVKESAKLPTELLTVFAGQEVEAVAKAREFIAPFPPSSPAIGLYKNGELVHFIERHNIEGRSADMIAENLKAAFDEYC